MLKKITLILFTIFVLFATCSIRYSYASSNISGLIGTNTTFTASGSPYHITGSTMVDSGVTLTIQPGVVLQFDAGVVLQVATADEV